jgi:uncharacterized protein YjiS (DUF1127 family)
MFAALRRGIAAALRYVADAVAAALEARRTARELHALDDHLLKDLGLRRDQVDCVARGMRC